MFCKTGLASSSTFINEASDFQNTENMGNSTDLPCWVPLDFLKYLEDS